MNTLNEPCAFLLKTSCLSPGDNIPSLFSTSSPVDDFVFEDFARLRLTGMKDEKDEGEPFC